MPIGTGTPYIPDATETHRWAHSQAILLPLPMTDTNNISLAATPVVDTTLSLAQTLLVPSTLMFNMDTGTGSATFSITGKNQFGEAITEEITLTTSGAATDEVTDNCFSEVTEIYCTAASSATDVIVGQNWNHASVRMHLAVPFKFTASEIAYVAYAGNAATVATADDTYYKIEVPQLAVATHSYAHVILNTGTFYRF